MSDPVLFQMWSRHRADFIEKHRFYVSQAKQRLMSQFLEQDIRAEADREGERFLEENEKNFNPDVHDGSEFFEGAEDACADRYQLLVEMRDSVRLGIISGFFHDWEKNLRQWLVDEVRRYPWRTGESTRRAIWTTNLCAKNGGLFDLLESFGWQLKIAPYFPNLDACRLVVNVYKHGDGSSLDSLSKSYPKFLKHPLDGLCDWLGETWSYEHLSITDENIDEFSDAVQEFWKDVPENVFNSEITDPPGWLIKAIEKDNNKKEQTN
ncbi:hypothetical protein [Cereibacter azotoformans]|uniref:Uncharacterized protein n=1 Tax=Cereibacter azotoformans TaxID=43057 RepID=A0A2T5JM74_9RHOB|nr:hypothetical protein [Cereibacter azotoformans]MBO4168849.1 hypothetical protein [Cereibacter azotoformans]PTR08159.1 hypothetical protein C8J28_1375 [Cereibacter azotoformans]